MVSLSCNIAYLEISVTTVLEIANGWYRACWERARGARLAMSTWQWPAHPGSYGNSGGLRPWEPFYQVAVFFEPVERLVRPAMHTLLYEEARCQDTRPGVCDDGGWHVYHGHFGLVNLPAEFVCQGSAFFQAVGVHDG